MLFQRHSMRSILMIGLGILALGAHAADAPRQQWQADIGRGYQQLANSADQLDQAAGRYCSSPSEGNRRQLEQDWKAAFRDWQAIRFVDFGPIEQASRAWQIQFWPDSKNLVARKVGYALKHDAAIDERFVDAAGVALQGFPAIEYLLFDASQRGGETLPAARSCELLRAITAHLNTTTRSLAEDWTRFSDHYIGMDDYSDKTVEAGLNSLEILQDRRLAAPMGLRGTPKRNPYLGDAWRSGYSLAAMRASVDGLDRYFKPGLTLLLQEKGEQKLADKLDRQLASTLEELNALPDALAPSLEDDEQYHKLQSLFIEMTQLEQVLANRIAPALGIRRGFNSSDGD